MRTIIFIQHDSKDISIPVLNITPKFGNKPDGITFLTICP